MGNIDLHDASTLDLTPAALHERGQTAMERGDLTIARDIYHYICVQTKNTDLAALKILAELEHQLGNSARAHEILVDHVTLLEYSRTGKVDPSTERLLQKYKAAMTEEPQEPDPDPSQLHTRVINDLIQKAKQNEDWERAVFLQRILISRHPENLRFAYFLAVFLRERGGQNNLKEALSILRELELNSEPQYVLSIQRKIIEIEVALAIGAGDLSTFEDQFFLEMGANFIVTFAKRARDAQDWPTVVRMQRLLIQISPDRVQSWMILASALRAMGGLANTSEATRISQARIALRAKGDRGSIRDFLK